MKKQRFHMQKPTFDRKWFHVNTISAGQHLAELWSKNDITR